MTDPVVYFCAANPLHHAELSAECLIVLKETLVL